MCGHAAIAVDSAARLSELNHSRFIIAAVSQTRRSGFLWIATSGRGHYGRRRLTRHHPQYLRTPVPADNRRRSEEHTSELQSLMRISYAVFCLKKKKPNKQTNKINCNYNHNKTTT